MTKTINRHTGEADALPNKNGAPGQESAVENTHPDHTEANERPLYHPFRFDAPVAGWHELGKVTRLTRKCKRTWRRKVGGAVQGEVVALLFLAMVAGLLLAGAQR